MANNMVQYILRCLKGNDPWVFLSWGAKNFQIYGANGLRFKTHGFKHKNFVRITYNEGTDLFDIVLEKNGKVHMKGEEKKRLEGVFFDELQETVDSLVEKTDNYAESIMKEYSIG